MGHNAMQALRRSRILFSGRLPNFGRHFLLFPRCCTFPYPRTAVPLTTHPGHDDLPEPGEDGASPAPGPDWQQALAALRALAGAEPAAGAEARRLLWALTLDADGVPGTIEPLEQVRGARGWG